MTQVRLLRREGETSHVVADIEVPVFKSEWPDIIEYDERFFIRKNGQYLQTVIYRHTEGHNADNTDTS